MSSVVPTDSEIIHALADDLPVGLWVARAPGGEEIYTNRMFAEIMGQGLRGDATVGNYTQPYGIFTRDGQPYPEQRLPFVRALVERRVVTVDDLTIHRPDGSRVHVRAFARPAINDSGQVTHVAICFFDITREVEAESAKAESERRLYVAQRLEAIGTLAGGIAHDFNNLIFGVKLIAAELAASEQDPHRREALKMIDDITDRSAMLTRSLLGFARRGKHRNVAIALDDVIDAMSDMLRRTIAGVQIGIETSAEDRGTVVGDRAQLEQVVMNLVVNARDALRDSSGGRVVVRTRSAALGGKRHVLLEVADNGPGIPDDLRDRVFEPYFTTKTQGSERGTGLGLATVFGIVEGHGGSIEIAAGLDGRGATLRVYIPAAAHAAAQPEPRLTATRARGTGVILVVDDDDLVRRALAGTLEGLGYTPVQATDGMTAIELYRARRSEIRAVMLDMVMPELSGRATYAALREIDPKVAVLLMSGHAMNDDVQAILDLGVKAFLTKPYSVEELSQSLAGLLDSPR